MTGDGRGAHKRPHAPAPEPGKKRRADETQTHTGTHHPARNGGVDAWGTHEHTHTPTPQPEVAGHSRNPSPSTDAHTAHCSQEWRGTSGARTPTDTRPNTPASSGGARLQLERKHTLLHRTPSQEGRGTRRDAHTNTHTGAHVSQDWRGAAQAHTPTPHTRARNGGVQAERAHNHARPKASATNGGVQAKTQAQPHTPQTPAGNGGARPQPVPKHIPPRPRPGLARLPKPGSKHNPDPKTNAT